MFWNLIRLWEISLGEVKEKGDKSVCEGMKKKYNKNGSCTSVMCLEKKCRKMTHEKKKRKKIDDEKKKWKKIQKQRMCMLWKK